MYSKNERANKAMMDAVAAGVMCFQPGPHGDAKIAARPEGYLVLEVRESYGEREKAVLSQIARWTGLDLSDTRTAYIEIRRWLNQHY